MPACTICTINATDELSWQTACLMTGITGNKKAKKYSGMKWVFATNNAHKLQEVREILPKTVQVISLHEVGFDQDIDETGKTLEENSYLKAETVYAYLRTAGKLTTIDGVFADDTGLEINALDGEPGVYTARWAGEPVDAAANRQKALRELAGKTDRSAQFRTVVTLIRSVNEATEQVEGVVRGTITIEERGEGGFGYDSVFIPEGYEKTFAELPAETKNRISHRARAIHALCTIL